MVMETYSSDGWDQKYEPLTYGEFGNQKNVGIFQEDSVCSLLCKSTVVVTLETYLLQGLLKIKGPGEHSPETSELDISHVQTHLENTYSQKTLISPCGCI
jgi:hypothetical protein